MKINDSILQSKFFLPQLINDFVERKELNTKLEQIIVKPLTLVSAPTGYGKSTLISAWLKQKKTNFTWLSLSDQENEFQRFIIYFTYAIHKKNNTIGTDILELSTAPEMPTLNELADYFIHHLSELPEHFILILDDYHLIRNKQIHQFISKLFDYPLQYFRLIIITRRDPALPLSVWRSKNLISEIRARDLRFKRSEIIDFFRKSSSVELNNSALNVIEKVTEGWISGLRLLLLTFKNKIDINKNVLQSGYKESHIFQRLLYDVMQKLPDNYKEYLIKLSVVEEFNQSLFTVLCLKDNEIKHASEIFTRFVVEITDSNLFIIALDDKHNWFRFHHLITELLQEQMNVSYGNDQLKMLKHKVAKWFDSVNEQELRLKYLLQAEQFKEAIEVFSVLKNNMLTNSNWQKLENIYKWFPKNSIHCYTTLLIARAWILIYKGNIPEMIKLIQPIENLIEKENLTTIEKENLWGELHMLKAWDRYNLNIDMEACLYHSLEAIRLIKTENSYPLGIAWIFYGGAMQNMQKSNEAKLVIYEEMAKDTSSNIKANLYLILCYIEWLDGDLKHLLKTAGQMEMHGNSIQSKEVIANSKYFKGVALYFQNKIHEAHKEFQVAYRFHHFTIFVHGFFAVTAIAFSMNEFGDEKGVERLIGELEMAAIEKGGRIYVQLARSIAAELEWKRKKSRNALKWAKETSFEPIIPMSNFTSTQLAQLKILATDIQPSSWKKAESMIDEIIAFVRDTNNSNFLIRILIVKSVLQYKLNKSIQAFETLKEAFKLASERNFIQPFVKMKEELAGLLSKFSKELDGLKLPIEFAKAIIQPNKTKGAVITIREKEILSNMSENLSNKELGSRLFISETTVKRHIANIFKKLQVSSRHEAIAKAQELNVM